MDYKPITLASEEEEALIARRLMAWLNTYPELPHNINTGFILYEQLANDVPGMAMSTIQGANITKRYITGGHEAEYQFKLVYRIKPGTSNGARLDADEMLKKIGIWAMRHKPYLGEDINGIRVEATSDASVFAAYEDGDEDHQILMKLTYEVL